jgi:hypothetical protein
MDAKPPAGKSEDTNDDEESVLELDGVDVEDIGEAEEDIGATGEEDPQAVDNDSKKPAGDPKTNDDDEAARKDLEAREEAELESANRERQELLKSAGTVDSIAPAGIDDVGSSSLDGKMAFLMKQSDVFAQFLAGVVASENTKKKKNAKVGGRGRMSEQEEDARLLKSAQSKLRVVRLDHQPGNLASHCKMHPYQLEGLNWLISK